MPNILAKNHKYFIYLFVCLLVACLFIYFHTGKSGWFTNQYKQNNTLIKANQRRYKAGQKVGQPWFKVNQGNGQNMLPGMMNRKTLKLNFLRIVISICHFPFLQLFYAASILQQLISNK